jgi:hypothetical protein
MDEVGTLRLEVWNIDLPVEVNTPGNTNGVDWS